MRAFRQHTGLVAPFDRSNVDTDLLLPRPFLKRVGRTGFGAHLFDDLRYRDPYVEGTAAERRENPGFILNRYPWRHATVLLSRANFGCGSSREHAIWALDEFGFRVVIAESFSDIFYSNAIRNGLLPVRLAARRVDEMFELQAGLPALAVLVDLDVRQVVLPTGGVVEFEIDPSHRDSLIRGEDEIEATLRHRREIEAFERNRLACHPWL